MEKDAVAGIKKRSADREKSIPEGIVLGWANPLFVRLTRERWLMNVPVLYARGF